MPIHEFYLTQSEIKRTTVRLINNNNVNKRTSMPSSNARNNNKVYNNKFKSENSTNKSASDEIISKLIHSTSSRDNGKITKRIPKSKKSAYSVKVNTF